MDNVKQAMDENTCTTLFGMNIIFIFGCHLFFSENAIDVMEIRAVVLKESAESLSLNLVGELVESVAIDEELFF